MELWELVARERIRDTLALYNWSGDAFRLDDLAGAFCDDGVLEVRGSAPLAGHAAIIGFLRGAGSAGDVAGNAGSDAERRAAARAVAEASGVRRIVRHNLTNLRFRSLTPHEALVETYFTVVTEIGLDHYGRYRDTLVPVPGEDRWLIRHRFVSTDWRSPDSKMAAPSSVS